MGEDKLTRRKAIIPALKGTAKWAGVTTISSGDATVVVSASQAKSGMVIRPGLGVTSVASHRARSFSVNSLVDNTSFIIVSDEALVDDQEVNYVVVEV